MGDRSGGPRVAGGDGILNSTVLVAWGRGAVGSASDWQSEGQGFESPRLHQADFELGSSGRTGPTMRTPHSRGWDELTAHVIPANVLWHALPIGNAPPDQLPGLAGRVS